MSSSYGRVCSLGMFMLDRFEDKENGTGNIVNEEQIGGGGLYAMIGARTFLPAPSVGLIVDRGIDFPQEIQTRLEEYGPAMFHFRDRTDGERLTTRTLNIYSGKRRGEGHQSFRYLTPKLQLFPLDLATSPFFRQIPPAYLHIVCSAARALLILDQIDMISQNGNGTDGFGKGWNPELVWEPMPSDCIPNELQNIITVAATQRIKILSPNHIEALSLLGVTPSTNPSILSAQVLKATYDLACGLSPGSSVIVRAGAMGACVCVKDKSGQPRSKFIPAYHGKDQQAKVVDATGGGNAFLGGVCAGLLLANGDVFEASLYGMVAASFAIEQYGLPKLAQVEGTRETWNGEDPLERMRDLMRWTEEENQY